MDVRYPKFNSIAASMLSLALVMLTGACTKASKSVSAAKDGSNFGSTVPELAGPFAPNKSISDAIRFIITTKEGRVLPGINVEFKAFDITAASQAGLQKTVIADAMRSKWNNPAFVMDAKGAIMGTSCDAGTTRESCVGILSGASKATNQLGEASVGFTTPNYPSGVIAIALRVQEDSAASELLQFVTVRITSNEEFATSGIEKLDSSLIVIPSLFGPNGEQVLKAGVPFNLSLVIPGIPNTKSGQGFEFNFQIDGLGDISQDKAIVLPSGKLKCDFRNSQCVVPGGPFKVLKPGNLKISVSPPNSRFPVKSTSLELPITTGAATRMVLSLTPIETGINNACVSQGSADVPCLELSADEAERTLYPIIVDDAGNFVSKTSTSWSATGPLSGAKLKKGPTVVDDQILVPDVAGRGVLTVMSTTFPGISTAVTYAVRSGAPSTVVLRNENDGFERAGREFKVKVELYDKKNNLCLDYFRPVKLSLALENGGGVNTNLPQSITSDVTPVTTIDQTTEPVMISAGLGITTKSFMIAKIDPNALDSELPSINLVSGEIDEVGKPPLVQREKTNFLVRQGDVTQTVLRMADLGRGNVWLDASNPCPSDDSVYCLRTDKNYYFYNAGYDRAGNFVQDVPSDFWGVDYNITDAYNNFAQTGSTPVQTLGALDPGDFAEQANCLNPNVTPDPLFPANSPTNQPADGVVFCSIHRGLGVKSGSSTSYKAAGLAGTGRVLAIPKNRTIRAALSPRLKISGGTTSKFVIELRSVLNNVKLTPPVVAGEQFRIYIYARDDQNFTTVDFAGLKHFYLTRGGEPSWLGFKSKLPNGLVSCDFGGLNSQNYNEPGVCELPGIYYVAGSRLDDTSSIVIEQTAGSGDSGSSGISDVIIPGSYSITIPAVPGPEKRLVFSTFRSGVSVPNNELTKNGPPDNQNNKVEPLIPSSVLAKSYREIDADQEKGLGLVITDEMGNYIRDIDPVADSIEVEGFLSPTDTLTGVFDETTGVWADPANKYTASDVFKKTDQSPDKFLYPSKLEHLEFISNPFFKTGAGKDLYSTIFIPQNRFGNGYAVAKSLTNPNLVGWPSPWMKVTPGKPDHIEMFPIADANATTPAGDLSTGQCYRVKMFIKDVRGNVVTDYSGSPYGVFKLFNASLKETLSYNTLANFPATGITNKLYHDKATNNYYYWGSGQYVATINPNSETESFYGFDEFPETGASNKYFHDRLYDKYYFWNSESAIYVETPPPEVDVNDKFALDFARFREAQDPTRRSGYWGFAGTVTELLNFYDARNRADIPGPYSDGFALDTDNGIAGGGPAGGDAGFGFEKTMDAPPKHHENWVARYLNVYQGEIRDLRDEGGVCFYTGQTRLTRQDAFPAIQKYMQVDIEAFDLSQNGGRTFDAITSRGAGRTHKKDETVIYRSLAKTPAVYHGDMFTVRRGQADHLHAVYNDSWEYPNLIPNVNNGNNALIMVTDTANCPQGNFGLKCAGQKIYWHVHDWTHNYIRPAFAGTYTANAAKPYPYFDHYSSFPFATSIGYCAPGANKSPCTMILPPVNAAATPPVTAESRYLGSTMGHKVWGIETRPSNTDIPNYPWPANHTHLAAGNWSETQAVNRYFSPSQTYLGSPPGASFKRGVYFQFMPGPMWELKLTRNGPASLTVDDYFSFDASLLDMYGNVTGAGTWQRTYPFGPGYNISRKLHVWYEQDPVDNIDVPSESPSGEKAKLFNKIAKPTSVTAAKSAGTSYSMLAPTGWAWGTSLSLNPNLPNQQARLVKANQTVRIRARVEDDGILPVSMGSSSSWCTGTKCKIAAVDGVSQAQYIEASIDVTPLPGARTGVVIYDRGKGLEYTSNNFSSIFQSARPGDIFPIVPNALRTMESYLCDKDQFGNMGSCSFAANWEVVENTVQDLVAGGVNSQTKAFEWSPRKPGKFKLKASRNAISFTSDFITIQGKPLDKFVVEQDPLSETAGVQAGQSIPFKICMADDLDNPITTEILNSNGQVVTNPNGPLNIEFNSLLAGKNAEDQSIEFSASNSFANKFTSGVQPVTFNAGCANMFVRVLNARSYNTPLFQLNYDDQAQPDVNNIPKRVTGNGIRVATVTPQSAHHFVTKLDDVKVSAAGRQSQAWSQYGNTVQLASADGNIFSVRFEARDQYGNPTSFNQQVNVKLREANGDEISYNGNAWKPMCDNVGGTQCLTGTFQNLSELLVQNIALDIGGRPIFVVAETVDGAIVTDLAESEAIIPVTSAKTVASYTVDASQATSVVAGQSFNIRVTALDKAGQIVKGAQAALSDIDFEWFSTIQQGADYVFEGLIEDTHKSLDGQSPIVKRNNSPKILFADGWADHPMTLVKAETVRLNLREVSRQTIKSSNTTPTVVTPGAKVRYSVTCQVGGVACDGASFAIPAQFDAAPTSRFSLTVSAFDQYKNPKNDGPLSPVIELVQEAGDSTTVGFLETHGQQPGNVSFDLNNKVSDTKANLFRRSAGKIKYTVSKSSANWDLMYKEVFHSYAPHIEMVHSYDLTGIPSTPVAGTSYIATVTAKDIAGNQVKNLASALSGQTYEWKGSGYTGISAPAVNPPSSLSFDSNGVATASIVFKKSEGIADFFLKDTYSRLVSGTFTYANLTYRRSGSLFSPNALSVRSANDPARFVIEHATGASSVSAGDAFNVKVTALDALGNVVTDYGASGEQLKFTYVGAESTDPARNPRNPSALTPIPSTSPINALFSSGVYTSTDGPFKLYVAKKLPSEANRSVTLKVEHAVNANITAGQVVLTVIPESTPGYVLMTRTAAYNGPSSVLETTPFTVRTDQTLNLYGHLFDQYGNYLRTDPGIRWSGSDAFNVAGTFTESPAASVVASPQVTGTGTITAQCPSSAGAQCAQHQSNTITVNASALKSFSIEQSPAYAPGLSVAAGSIIDLTVCMRDVKGQLITQTVAGNADPNGQLSLSFNTIEGMGLHGPNAEDKNFLISPVKANFETQQFTPQNIRPLTFSQGCASFYIRVQKSGSGAAWTNLNQIQLSYNDAAQNAIISGKGLKLDAVTPGPLHHYRTSVRRTNGSKVVAKSNYGSGDVSEYAETNPTSGNLFDFSVIARDVYGNNVVPTANTTVSLSLVDDSYRTQPIVYGPKTWRPICGAVSGVNVDCADIVFNGSQSFVDVLKAALDIGGRRMYVSASSAGGVNTDFDVSNMVEAINSKDTVKNYEVNNAPTSLKAGETIAIQVTAKDNAGQPIKNAADSLSSVQFDWVDAAGNVLISTDSHRALDAGKTPPIVSSSLSFNSNGVASSNVTLVRVGSLNLNIQDRARISTRSSTAITTSVVVGDGLVFALTCAMMNDPSQSCTGSTATPFGLAASPTSSFAFTLKAFDQYQNPKSNINIQPRISLAKLPGSGTTTNPAGLMLEQNNGASNTPEFSGQRVFGMASVNWTTVNNLFHRAGPHTIEYAVDPASATQTAPMLSTVRHAYTAHPAMVYEYKLTAPAASIVASQAATYKLEALDRSGNLVVDSAVDTHLNSRTFGWSGPAASGVNAPVYPNIALAGGLQFSGGAINALPITFKMAEDFSLFAYDNYTPHVAGVGGYHSDFKVRSPAVTTRVSSGGATKLVLEPTTASPVAGDEFNVVVVAKDANDNVVTSFTSANLTFDWNASPSQSNVVSGVQTPAKPTNGQKTFDAGRYTPAAGERFKLYYSNPTTLGSPQVVTLTVTADGVANPGTATFTVQPRSEYSYVRMTENALYAVADDAPTSGTINMNTAMTKTYYGHLFDRFGNYRGLNSGVQWSGTVALLNKFSPTLGQSSVLTPNVAGTGQFKADCSLITGASSCVAHQSATVAVSASPLNKFKITHKTGVAGAIANNATITAGTTIPLDVCMYDVSDQPITTNIEIGGVLKTQATEADVPVRIDLTTNSITSSLEGNSIKFSKTSNFASPFAIGAGTLDFVNGCASLYAKIYSVSIGSAADKIKIQYNDVRQNDIPIVGKGLNVAAVNNDVLDHYTTGITSSNGYNQGYLLPAVYDSNDLTYAASGGYRTDLIVYARDVYGNAVQVTTNKTINLRILDTNGAEIVGKNVLCPTISDTSCRTVPLAQGQSQTVVSKLGFNFGGRAIYVDAFDGTYSIKSGGVIGNSSMRIYPVTSEKTVKDYVLSLTNSITAGSSVTASITARDAYGEAILNAESALGALRFNFLDGSGNDLITHTAPNSQAPTIGYAAGSDRTLPFASNGIASVDLTLVKKETNLQVRVRDKQATYRESALVTTSVDRGNTIQYKITCVKNGGGTCNGLSGSPTSFIASPTARFSLTVQAYDQFQNTRQGESDAYIKLVHAGGTALNVGRLESTDVLDKNTFTNEIKANTLTTNGDVTLTNLFHRSGNHTITYQVYSTANPNPTMLEPIYHEFTAHGDMVYRYALGLSTMTPVAGTPVNLTITAKDIADNDVTGLDTYLNGRTFAWSGANTAPSGATADAPTGSFAFNANGVSNSKTFTFKRAESIATFALADNHAAPFPGTGGTGTNGSRVGSVSNVVVSNATAAKYDLQAVSGLMPKAGDAFSVNILVKDTYDNPVKNNWTDNVKYSWTGASSQVNPKINETSVPIPASETTASSVNFGSSGSYSISGLKLFKANETPVLNVAGTSTSTAGGAILSKTLQFGTTLPNDTASYVKITTDGTYSAATELGTTAQIVNAGIDYTYFAHLFDPYGNYKGQDSRVTWTLQAIAAGTTGTLGASGSSSKLTPTSTGSLTITAYCGAISGSCSSETTGTFTVLPGAISRLAWTVSPATISQTTDECVALEVEARDSKDNPVPVNGTTLITFNSTGGNGDFYDSIDACNNAQNAGLLETPDTGLFHTPNAGGSTAVTGVAGQRSKSLLITTARTQVWYANRTPNASVSVKATFGNAETPTITGAVTAGAARRFAITSTEASIYAIGSSSGDTCSTIQYKFQDRWLNNSTASSASSIKLSDSSGSGSFYSDSGCTTMLSANAGISTHPVNANTANTTVYYANDNARGEQIRLEKTGSLISGNSVPQGQSTMVTVYPGPFNITSPTSGSNQKHPVTFNWSNSSGKNNYSLSYSSASNCSGAIILNSATSNQSYTWNNTSLNGTYYLCLVANGVNGVLATAPTTTAATYSVKIDNTIPTGAITTPGSVTLIGPSTAATHFGAANTTVFAGTATDETNGSGLSKVEISLKQGSSDYWSGTAFVNGSEQWLLASGTTNWTYAVADNKFTNNTNYVLSVKVTDNATNLSTVVTKSFTWRSVAPTATIPSGAPAASTTSNWITLGTPQTGVTIGGTDVLTYSYKIVSATSSCSTGGYSAWTAVGSKITDSLPNATYPEGTVTLCVLGRDEAENEQATATVRTWTKDVTAPSVADLPATVTVNAAYAASPTITDNYDTDAQVNYTWSWVAGSGTNGCSGANISSTSIRNPNISLTGCTNNWGTGQVRLVVTDRAGNSRTSTSTIQWDQQQPYVSKIAVDTTIRPSGRYKAGVSVPLKITFKKDATFNSAFTLAVTGSPKLTLNIASTNNGAKRVATMTAGTYSNSSGTVTVDATYTISSGDADQFRNGVTLNAETSSPFTLDASNDVRDNTGTPGTQISNANSTSGINALSNSGVIVDTVGPVPSASLGTGAPSDGYINLSEVTSTDALITAAADSGDTLQAGSAQYVLIGSGVTCAINTAGLASSIPTPTSAGMNLLASGDYKVCMKLTDAAGNDGAASSGVIKLDKDAPQFTSLYFANEATDAKINDSEKNSSSNAVGTPTYTMTDPAASNSVTYAKTQTAMATNADCSGAGTYSATVPTVSSLNAEGSWYVCVKLTDVANNVAYGLAQQSSVSTTKAIVRDTTLPSIDTASFVWQGEAADFYLNDTEKKNTGGSSILSAATSASETGASFSYALVASGTACNSSVTYGLSTPPDRASFTSEAVYRACVKITDSFGNPSYFTTQNATTNTVNYDATAPTLTYTLTSSILADTYINLTESSQTTVLAAISNHNDGTGSGVVASGWPKYVLQATTTACNAAAFASAGSTSVPLANSTDFGSDGTYRLCAQTKDNAGNLGYITSTTINLKKSTPSISSVSLANEAADGWLNINDRTLSSALVTVSSTGGTATKYAIVSSATACDGSPSYGATATNNSGDINSDATTWKVCVRVEDASSNYVYLGSSTFRRDIVKPTYTNAATNGFARAGIASDGFINATEASGAVDDILTAISSVDANAVTFRYATLATAAACDATVATWTTAFPIRTTLSADGSYKFCAEMKDAAGNIDYAASSNITRDTVTPTLAFYSGTPSARSNVGISTNKFLNVAISNNDTSKYYYAVLAGYGGCDSASYSTAVNQSSNITNDMSGFSDGWVTICALAEDAAGNKQLAANATAHYFTRDTTAPAAVTITAPSLIISNKMPTITWTTPAWVVSPASPIAADPHTQSVKVGRDSGCTTPPTGGSFAGLTGNPSTNYSQALTGNLDDGLWYICVTATDNAGNSSTASGSFELETDTVHISWTDSNGVRYARYENLAWTTETVANGGGSYDGRTSLQLDGSGVPYVSFKLDDGSNTSLRYRKRTAANSWSTGETTVGSLSNSISTDIGAFNELGIITNQSRIQAAYFGLDTNTNSIFGLTNIGSVYNQIQGTAASFTDMAIGVGTVSTTNEPVYSVVVQSGQLKIIKKDANPSTMTLPASCSSVSRVSAATKNDNTISLAIACHDTSNSCSVYYGDVTYTSASDTYSGPAASGVGSWTTVGTIKTSGCDSNTLTDDDRPSIMVDRQNLGKVSIAWNDQTNNKLNHWTNESGPGVNTQILTGATSIAQQTVALDALGKTYIIYKDGDALKYITNNGRVTGAYTNVWSAPTTIVSGTAISGVGTIGITGMKGRGNFSGGK